MTDLTDDYIANPVEERVPNMKRAFTLMEGMSPSDRVRFMVKVSDLWCSTCGEKKAGCACKKE